MSDYMVRTYQIAEPSERNWAYIVTHGDKVVAQSAAWSAESVALGHAAVALQNHALNDCENRIVSGK